MKYADTLKAALDTATQAREAFDAAPKGEGNIVMWQAHSVLDEARAEISDLLVNKGPELLRLIEAVQARANHYCHWPMQKCDDPDCTSDRAIAEESAVFAALADLNAGER